MAKATIFKADDDQDLHLSVDGLDDKEVVAGAMMLIEVALSRRAASSHRCPGCARIVDALTEVLATLNPLIPPLKVEIADLSKRNLN